MFYTSLGHREDVWDPKWPDRKNSPQVAEAYQKHILGGIKWALGLENMERTAAEDGGRIVQSPTSAASKLICMNENESETPGYNRRDFLKGGSAATVMTMLGAVELIAQTNAPPAGEAKGPAVKIKVGVIGLGAWGREIINTLARLPQADVVAICDTYAASLKRIASAAPERRADGGLQDDPG